MSKKFEQISDTEDHSVVDPKTKSMMEALRSELGKILHSKLEGIYEKIG